MAEPVIVGAVRSPIGRAYKGSLVGVRGDDLAVQLAQVLLEQSPQLDPGTIDEVLVGCSLAAGEQGGNLGRIVPVMLGFDEVPGCTVNRYCASSMQTTRMASDAIRAGTGHVYLSMGVEVVSSVATRGPDPTPEERNAVFVPSSPGEGPWRDPRRDGRTPDVFITMGETAENVASIKGVSRSEMDEFAFRSQQLAAESTRSGFWDIDITPVTRADGSVVSHDDSPRPGTTLEGLAELQPAFRHNGSVTAGNCCPLNDGVAGLLIMSDERAAELGIRPRARILATATSAISPEVMGLAPIAASRAALAAAGLSASDIDLVEINEAFAAQVIPCYRELGFPLDKVNVKGGAIAVGHPFGMSGARITTTLLNALKWEGKRFGLQTMCVAGGQGMAMVVELLD